MVSDRAEEALETLWMRRVEQEEPACPVEAIADEGIVGELQAADLVRLNGDKLVLTDSGLEEAAMCVRRHRLAERLMADVLRVKDPLVHEAGCDMEHLLHRGLDENICTLLGHPQTCPHGRPIPEGRCCREARRNSIQSLVPMTDLDLRRRAVVAYVHMHNRDALRKLLAIGLLPGTELKLLQRTPALVFQTGRCQFAIDEEMARHVIVRYLDPGETVPASVLQSGAPACAKNRPSGRGWMRRMGWGAGWRRRRNGG